MTEAHHSPTADLNAAEAENVQAALGVMQAHIEAINARDEEAIAATLHFPHFRLTDGTLKVWENKDTYLADFRTRAGSDWSHSDWGRLKPVQIGEDKVHLDVQVDRYTTSGESLISFSSLWVIARIDGVWAAQLRSSFAPDARIIKEDQA